ncbi:MAG: Ig-like domain-containing protein [Gemmatimonadaceae bacterium]
MCQPLAVGDSAYAIASAHRASGFPGSGAYSSSTRPEAFAWQTSDPNVATVSRAGLVTAVAPGTTKIAARTKGLTGEREVGVTRVAMTAAVFPTVAELGVGDTILLGARAWNEAGTPIPVAGSTLFFTDGDARVVHVWEQLPSGARLIGIEPGTAHVSWKVGQRCGAIPVYVR